MADTRVLELSVAEDGSAFASSIGTARAAGELELAALRETVQSAARLRPDCDKLDYALAASSGALCGLMDIFLVGKPGESPAGDAADQWFSHRTMDFARLCGWDGKGKVPLSSAVGFLERKFQVPYDQRGAGDAASRIVHGLTPGNHHFKSLGHNPTLLGLFFSILDQFTNQSHFVSGGELRILQDADGGFSLRGGTLPARLFCGFVNWFGHLVSDLSGSSGSGGRGMGLPSPIWAWTNDIVAVTRQLGLPLPRFCDDLNELALRIYRQGFDLRFQAAQAVPVLVNELMTRCVYSIRRMVKYYAETPPDARSAAALWEACEPFSNAAVKRMLTVAHGTFCLMDLGDAAARGVLAGGGAFHVTEFLLRLNVVGVGRFTISLYGEAKRAVELRGAESEARFAQREKTVVENYLAGLSQLAALYDDRDLVNFVDDLKNSDLYLQAFEKSAKLAELRKVPEEKILRTKADIDSYFRRK